ncbi:MAG: hypothetical protein ACR2H3_00095 [Acidimicrobiales bacterium]
MLKPDDSGRAEEFNWHAVAELVHAYETGAATHLTTSNGDPSA